MRLLADEEVYRRVRGVAEQCGLVRGGYRLCYVDSYWVVNEADEWIDEGLRFFAWTGGYVAVGNAEEYVMGGITSEQISMPEYLAEYGGFSAREVEEEVEGRRVKYYYYRFKLDKETSFYIRIIYDMFLDYDFYSWWLGYLQLSRSI